MRGRPAIEDLAEGMRLFQVVMALGRRGGMSPSERRWLQWCKDVGSLSAARLLGVEAPAPKTWGPRGPTDGLLDGRTALRLEAALLDAGFDPLGLLEADGRG